MVTEIARSKEMGKVIQQYNNQQRAQEKLRSWFYSDIDVAIPSIHDVTKDIITAMANDRDMQTMIKQQQDETNINEENGTTGRS